MRPLTPAIAATLARDGAPIGPAAIDPARLVATLRAAGQLADRRTIAPDSALTHTAVAAHLADVRAEASRRADLRGLPIGAGPAARADAQSRFEALDRSAHCFSRWS